MDIEKERESIRQTLQYFFDGLDNLDAETIRKAFHPETMSYCVVDDGLDGKPVSHWNRTFKNVQNNPDHPFNEKSRKNIVYIDITGTAASAKVEWTFTKLMFSDYYNLIKLDGRWLIMNKIFHTTFFEK